MNTQIAVIGIAGRFPDAPNLDKLAENLRLGINSLRPISENRIKATTLPQNGNYHQRGYMENVDCFDYKFFNIPLGEAETIDPRQRILLEVVYEAIENAGYDASTLEGTDTAVFATYSQLDYYKHAQTFSPTLVTGNGPEFLAARINRVFNLKGCVSVIDTSCSSGLVAIHHACNEILTGNATQAIVCGASLELFPDKADGYDVGIESIDGKSIPFSKNANGMAFGEGSVALLIKSYDEAIKDGDNIQAIILGSAVNSNAARSASLTAPDSEAQAEVLLKAWKKAGIDVEALTFIEAHGSGTLLGDSLEIGGLNLAFKKITEKRDFCSISTIKSNIGHSRSVAGLAGFAKAVLSLKNQEIYPSVYDNQPNPHINFSDSAVYISNSLQNWENTNNSRIAGVSSMGFSGTNCHIVLNENISPKISTKTSQQTLILLSAHQKENLIEFAKKLEEKVSKSLDLNILDIAHTLGAGRKKYEFRHAFFAKDNQDLIENLKEISSTTLSGTNKKTPKMIFVFGENTCQNETIDLQNTYKNAFISQYNQYQNLKSRGILPNKMIGYGIGKFVIEAITEKVSFDEALSKVDTYQHEQINDFAHRTQILIDRETSSQFIGFVALCAENQIINQLVKHEKYKKNYEIIELNSTNENDILTVARALFLSNYQVNWQSFYQKLGGNKIELPTYQFSKTRCWIRETPKQETVALIPPQKAAKLIKESNYSSTEDTIAKIWSEIIEVTEISLSDNFFEIGGDSLKATKIINQINKLFGLRLDFEDFFDFPTLHKLAEFVDSSLPLESKVANIWKSVLKNADIKPNDDFFEMGGHSILANQIMIKVRESLAYPLNFDEFFQNPTISKLSSFLENQKNKKNLITKNQSKAPIAEYYSPSHSQKGLWILSQINDNSIAYNEFMAFELEGMVSIQALKKAFETIVLRHESLRTNFILIDGEPKQKISQPNESNFEVEYLDFSTIQNTEEQTWNYASTFANLPFNLETDSLIKVTAIKISNNSVILLINIHHIVFDEWSFKILISELTKLYNDFNQNKTVSLSPIDFQFKDYSHWVNSQINSNEVENSREYWAKQLSGEIETLQLPTDFAYPNNRTFEGKSLEYKFDNELFEKVKTYAKSSGLSLNMVLMGVVKVLLGRYSNQSDIIVGMPTSTRNISETEKMIGFFVNTLPIRTKIEQNLSFKNLLQSIKKTLIDAYQHQQYPLDLIIEDLTKSTTNKSQLFNVLIVHDKSNLRNQTTQIFEGVTIKEYGKKREKVKFDLDFTFNETDENLYLTLGFSTELFRTETAKNLLNHFENLLKNLISNDSESILNIKFLSKNEEIELLEEFNRTDFPFEKEKTVFDLIKKQFAETPTNQAIVFGEKVLNYQELHFKSNQLAQRLEGLGIQKNDIVPLIMSRGIDYVVSCIAIMKVGGAFAPISRLLPFERVKEIICEVSPKIVLLNNDTTNQFGNIHESVEIIDSLKLNQEADFTIKNRLLPDDLMYVIYTSGSTGRPKGVMVPHRGIFNRLMWMNLYFGKETAQSVIRTTKHIYDSSVWQLFWPMTVGGKTIIPEEDFDGNTQYLFDLIEKQQITIVDFVPSMFEAVVENVESHGSKIRSLKSIILGGEAINLKTTQHFISIFPKIHVTNLYGPTEASIGCIAHKVEPSDTTLIPIGSPITNVKVLILDDFNNLVPRGHIGEICLSGVCLANGYLSNSELTNQFFVENPYGIDNYARMYKTGDLARWLPNGKIEFLGRKDSQVKIRGHRIELGEIENILLRNPKINDACVVVQNHQNSPQLVAFVVEKPDEVPPIIYQVNQTDVAFPDKASFDDLFKENVEKWKNRIAITDSEKSLTYHQLNQKVNLYAEKLIENGIKKGDVVPVCFERSVEMLIAILAIFRVGGVYVPIPTNTPLSRINEILDDCEASLMFVKNTETPNGIKVTKSITKINVSEINDKSVNALNIEISPNDLAYIIFTSGSTGKPKGVMIEHIGMINHLYAKINDLKLNESSIVVQNASQGFDISIWQFLSALLVGGKTIIFEEEIVKNPLNFVEKIQLTQPTILEVVPTYLRVLLDLFETVYIDLVPSMQFVLVTGEALKKTLVERWFTRFKQIKLVNAYGPTEASDDITHFIMDNTPIQEQIPIGKPLQNFKIYIVNQNGKLCKINEKGEIWVSGLGVGRGYLKDIEKTQKVFREDSFRAEKGVRLYQTGDLGCYLPDGNIAFFGRIDNQIKLRGYRIELNEIEFHLTQIEGIKDAVVVKKEDKQKNQFLHAYLIADKTDINPKETLKKSLPEYMIPQEFSFLEIFPTTANGKVDRNALSGDLTYKEAFEPINKSNFDQEIKGLLKKQLPDFMIPTHVISIEKLPIAKTGKIDRKYLASLSVQNQVNQQIIEPKNDSEAKLLSIWKKILLKEKISTNDDFFEIGGHSLKAIRMISAIDKEFQSKIGLKEIFQNPTIQLLALAIDKNNNHFDSIEPIEKSETYQLSNAQRRLWLLHQIDEAKSVYNLPGLFLINGKIDNAVVEQTFLKIIQRHESLRTSFEMIDNEPRQRVFSMEELNWSLKTLNLTNQADAYACCQRLAFEDNKLAFDLTKPPLVKIKLFKISQTKHILSFNIHHIVSDEWSFGVLIKEFLTIYQSIIQKTEALLPVLKTQYKDYAFWKQKQIKSDTYFAAKNYWNEQFSGVVPVLNLPTKQPRLQVQTYNGNNQTIVLDKPTTQKFLAINQQENTTLFMNLLASLNVLLYQYTHQTDITLGTPMAGREHPDLENQIGFFVNTVPIRNQFNEDFSYINLLKTVKSNTLQAYEHQAYPFDKIVDELAIPKDPSRSPLFDVMLVLEDEGVVEKAKNIQSIDFDISNINLEIPFSKFDLTFYFKHINEKLQIHLNYNTDLFDKEWINFLLNRLSFIINRISDDISTKINQIGITPAELFREKRWNENGKWKFVDFINRNEISDFNGKVAVFHKNQQVGVGIDGELFVDDLENLPIKNFHSKTIEAEKGLYPTGMIARYDTEGSIIIIGNKSRQITENGYELHLDWVEKIAQCFDKIEGCNAFVKDGRLVANLQTTHPIELITLKDHFRQKLPVYQIPVEFLMEADKTSSTYQSLNVSTKNNQEEKIIINVFEKILSKTNLSETDNFFDLGGDSIKAIQIITALYQKGYKIDYQDIFTYPNIYELAFILKPILQKKKQIFKESTILLSPIQERVFEAGFEQTQSFSMAMIVKSKKRLEPSILQSAIREIYKFHDGLRMKFWQEDNSIKQFNFEATLFPILETIQLDTYEIPYNFLYQKKQSLIEQTNINEGDLLKIVLCQTENGDYLLMVCNHLVIDGMSWMILLEDIMKAYQQIQTQKTVDLGLKSSSIYEWTNKIGFQHSFDKELSFWENHFTNTPNLKNKVGIKKTAKTTISVKETLALKKLNDVGYGNTENEILIASLTQSIHQIPEIGEQGIMVETHGRNQLIEDVELTRTVGWFTSIFPLKIEVSDDIQNNLLVTKQGLRQVPDNGIGYGWLKYFHGKINGNEPNILFNFLGNIDDQLHDSSIEFIDLPTQNQSKPQFLQFPIVATAWIMGSELNLEIAYNADIFKPRLIQNLLNSWKSTIVNISQWGAKQEEKFFAPTDFSYSNISIEEFENIFD